MSLVRNPSFVATLLLALASTGCFWKKKPPAPPATPPPQTKSTATLKPAPPPPKLETAEPTTAPPAVAVKLPDTPKPPQTKQPARRARRWNPVSPKTQAPPPPADSGPEALPAPAPKLGDLITDAQRADLLKRCDQAIQQARTALDQLAAKQLSPESAESAGRARVFIQQAEQARSRDPQTALQLAQRAEVLARDLLKSVR